MNSQKSSITKTKIKKHRRKKANPDLVETISLGLKNSAWHKVVAKIAGSTRNHSKVNLFRIEKEAEEGETVVVPGKVLSNGEISKKLRIVALEISERAREKIERSKSDFVYLKDEIKRNPKAERIKIIQ